MFGRRHSCEGLGNQFLGNIREVDAIVHVVRCFDDENIVHVEGSVDPLRDIEVIDTELMLKDLRLSQQAAEASDADTPLGAHATDLYATFVEQEDGLGLDFSAMLPRFEKKSRSG